jgi:hypothetical protein
VSASLWRSRRILARLPSAVRAGDSVCELSLRAQPVSSRFCTDQMMAHVLLMNHG